MILVYTVNSCILFAACKKKKGGSNSSGALEQFQTDRQAVQSTDGHVGGETTALRPDTEH